MSGCALPLVSYKLRMHEGHVRAVPATTPDGSVFCGPGVDLRGSVASAIIEAAAPMLSWLEAREPGVRVRSISVRLSGPRVLVSLEPGPADVRPRATRFDPPYAAELRDGGRQAEYLIGVACAECIAKRQT